MRIKSKKKLALLVSMALTVGSTLAVNPMDVYAATSVAWDAGSNQYKVTVGANEETTADAAEAITKIIAGLGTDADKNITIDLSDTTWQKDGDSQKAAKDLADALRDKEITLKSGADVKLTFFNGDAYTFVNGGEDSKVTLTKTDSILKVNGDITTVTAKIDGNRPAKIDVADGKTVGTITVSDGTKGTLALTGTGTVKKLDAQGDITVSATGTTLTEIAVAENKTLTTAGDIKAGKISGTGNVTANGALNVTGAITAKSVTAESVTAESVTADVTAGSLELTGSKDVTVNDSAKIWKVDTLKTTGNLTVNDASKLTVKSIESSGNLEISDASHALSADKITSGGTLNIGADTKVDAKNITSTGKMTIANAGNVAEGANIKTEGGLTVTDGDLNAGSLYVNGELTASNGTITADSVAFGSNATITRDDTTIKADAVTIDTTSGMDEDAIKKLKIAPKAEGGTVNVKVITSDGAKSEAIEKAIKDAAGANNVVVSVTSAEADKAQAAADEAIAKADEALGKVNEFAAKDAAKIAQANPFITKLPSASDIATIANPSTAQLDAVKATATDLEKAISSLDTEISKAESSGNTTLKAELEVKKATLKSKLDNVSSAAGMQAKAAELTAAVQQAGKTAAAPGVASARTATVVTNVMTANVTGRTSELRGFASAVDEGRPAPDNVWFQYKHTNMDVDNGDVYGKSTVKTNNYQLGYDAKVGPNDYLGAYIGTTTGNVEFNAPAVTDRTDIDNAYDFGIYGTHMLPSDQYIDYMIHTGKFDSKYNGVTWGTKDTGAMIGYGAKIAQNDRLTWNPYIQLAYDKVSVDSYMAGANYIASDDSNNWTAKLGINLLDVSGFYGGLAYSRGLSGSYNAYINGVPMPSQDNNANVLYMSLGYRANMSRNVFLDLSMEKTFADYNGWTAAGKVNFYF